MDRLVLISYLALISAGISIPVAQGQGAQRVVRMASVASARTQHLLGSVSPDGKSISVAQCRCDDIEECEEQLEEKSDKCKES